MKKIKIKGGVDKMKDKGIKYILLSG